MLNGHFENCYGLKQFDLPNINFSRCNKAMIYAPNGVMKSSLSKVFDDISKGTATSDRIFRNVVSSYSVTHYTSQYVFSSANAATAPTATDRIYVVNTFTDSFEFTKETVSTLLADETTRNERKLQVQVGHSHSRNLVPNPSVTVGAAGFYRERGCRNRQVA